MANSVPRTPVPRTYDEWKHCITVLCSIPLTPAYVEERIRALADPTNYTTQRLEQDWGAAHVEQVRSWFEQARLELEGERI